MAVDIARRLRAQRRVREVLRCAVVGVVVAALAAGYQHGEEIGARTQLGGDRATVEPDRRLGVVEVAVDGIGGRVRIAVETVLGSAVDGVVGRREGGAVHAGVGGTGQRRRRHGQSGTDQTGGECAEQLRNCAAKTTVEYRHLFPPLLAQERLPTRLNTPAAAASVSPSLPGSQATNAAWPGSML